MSVVDHRAAVAYLDQLAQLAQRRAEIDAQIEQLVRDRPAGVTQGQAAAALGISARGLRKRHERAGPR